MLPPTNKYKSHRFRNFTSFLLLLIWFSLLGVAVANRQDILDWWQLRNYQAPAPVAQLAAQDTMTDFGRKVFYVNHPAISPKAEFAHACPASGREQTIVLGCYHSDQAGIWLLDVKDPRLSGVQQVTAAHEMLHGAYDRLGSAERKQVNALLQHYYDKQLNDERIRKTINAYKQTEPDQLVNEMHSIFGTEIATLPPELEHYYQRYFTNRAQVAAYAAQYQAAFTTREATLKQLKSELDSLKTQIAAINVDLKNKQDTLSAKQSQLQSSRSRGDIAAYNAGVPAYNSLVEEFNQEIQTIKGLINRFNSLRDTYNSLVLEENELTNELKSDVSPINN